MGGVEVLDSGNVFDAIRIFKENKDQINLVITDIVMPDLSGQKIAEQIISIKPSIKILYITGFAKNFQAISTNLEPNMGILQKPFDRDTLIKKIRELLEK